MIDLNPSRTPKRATTKIADTSKQTFANFESANLAFLIDGLMPLIIELEEEANRKRLHRAIAGCGQPS